MAAIDKLIESIRAGIATRSPALARMQAQEELFRQRAQMLRLYDLLFSYVERGEFDAKTLDDMATLEMHLSEDTRAMGFIGRALGLAAYESCACWEAQDCAIDATHLPECAVRMLKKT